MLQQENDLLIRYALQFVGINYKWGGDDPMAGFDCSGFVQEILAAFGADPKGDQTAQALYDWTVDKKFPVAHRAGSLVFYGRTDYAVSHVSMLLNDDICIEAAGGGSKTHTKEDAIRHNAYIRLRPFDHRTDIVAIKYPSYPKSRLIN